MDGPRRLPATVRDAAAAAVPLAVRALRAVARLDLRVAATLHVLVSVGAMFTLRAGLAARRYAATIAAVLRPAIDEASARIRASARRAAAAIAGATVSLQRWARGAASRTATSLRAHADDDPLRGPTRSVIAMAGLVAGLSILGVALVTPAVVAADRVLTEARETIESVPPMPDDLPTPAQRSRVLAADGSVLAHLAEQNRIIVDLDRIPEGTRQAVLAIEDVRFHEHAGIDFRALGRAAAANLQEAAVAEGGSTITQQYVKNALLTADQTLDRKVVEAVYAVELERRKSKDEILESYLNIAYFGNGVYGIATAAEYYFGLEVEDLDVARSALLAGMIANPTGFDPIADPDAAQQRRDVVLRRMANAGFITDGEAQDAMDEPVDAHPNPLPEPSDPFLVEFVLAQLLADPALGDDRRERAQAVFTGGLEVETTLDPALQNDAEEAIGQHLTDPTADPLGAIVSLDPATGEVRALALGPREFGDCPQDAEDEVCPETQVNPVVPGMGGSGRQAGSAFKPLILAAALESGLDTDWSAEADSGTEIEGCGVPGEPWEVRNYDRGSPGTIDMVEAVRVSNNVYHAQLIAEIGPPAAVETARRVGIASALPDVCAIALGAADVFPLEMATAFGTFANDGVRCDPIVVSRVTDAGGEAIVEREPACEQVLDEDIAATITTMLREVMESGTGTAAQIGRDAAGKTGTTDDHRDAWFVGYVPQLVTATWIGYEEPREMRGILGHASIAGGTVPAQLWSTFMGAAVADLEAESLSSTSLERYEPDDDQDDDEDDDDGGSGGEGRGPDGQGPPGQRDG